MFRGLGGLELEADGSIIITESYNYDGLMLRMSTRQKPVQEHIFVFTVCLRVDARSRTCLWNSLRDCFRVRRTKRSPIAF